MRAPSGNRPSQLRRRGGPRRAAWPRAKRRLASLWGDEGGMRMALTKVGEALHVLDFACDDGAFPSVAAIHAPAGRLERAACDLFGFTAIDAPDARPWLDHGRWPVRHPLGRRVAHDGAADAYAFLGA